MATSKHLIFLVILAITNRSLQDTSDNTIENEINPLDEARADILKEQDMQNIGSMVNNFMSSEGAKHLGSILGNAAQGAGAGDLLQGLGSLMGQTQGMDPAMLGTIMNMFASSGGGGKQKSDDSIDVNSLFSLLGSFLGQSGESFNVWNYLPMILQTANAFLGPEAEARAKLHAGHADLMPPLLEKFHLLFDHFINSDLAKTLMNIVGAEKFVKVFADEDGKMSYRRFVTMLENHSFRKHWIRMVTSKIAYLISHISDSATQKKYLTVFQHFLNSILKSQGFPKSALFDQNRPTETITALVNYAARDQLKMKINSKPYVKAFISYLKELFRMADTRGMFNVDSQQMSDKLADTINLEMIEPIAKVNRGFRFARDASPECDKYVMCLVNKEPEDEKPSLPGLRALLAKSSSLIYSWFLSGVTKSPYLDLYRAIVEDKDCQPYYKESCHGFHLEEIRAKRNIVHSEL